MRGRFLFLMIIFCGILFAFEDENLTPNPEPNVFTTTGTVTTGKNIIAVAKPNSNYVRASAQIHGNDNISLTTLNVDSGFEYRRYDIEASFRTSLNESGTGFFGSAFLDIGASVRNHIAVVDEINADLNGYLIDLNFTFHFMFNPSFLLSATLSPGIHTDFSGFDHKHFYFSSILEMSALIGKNTAVSLGAKLYQRSDSWRILPLIGFYGQWGDFSAEALIPLNAKLKYQATKKVALYAAYEGVYDDEMQAELFNDGIEENTRVSFNTANLGIEYKVADNVTFFAEGGFVLDGKINDGSNSTRSDINGGNFNAKVGMNIKVGSSETSTSNDTDNNNTDNSNTDNDNNGIPKQFEKFFKNNNDLKNFKRDNETQEIPITEKYSLFNFS